ncbi:hypothetical protein MIND_01326300 [Mycena indigotica]|uniref:DUF6534 domain-containing protein n=1 Tax=Mycena indigotica TaxID=2126181 RepID=A0A8H6VSZ6_9AGAR|nr:uncharacterized protein MIND_01326300 [Mycena indigotica]KAF7290851.1 hypothetical protein MIND_01326300 [Mycena indigotica]
MQQDYDVRSTIGALYAGCMASVAVSAVLLVQTFLYFMIFYQDNARLKTFVGWIWAGDAAHTISICVAVWQYGVLHFGRPMYLATISPALTGTVVLTGINILNANIFYSWRIHKMSKGNLWLTIPIAFLCLVRLIMTIFLSVVMTFSNTWDLIEARYGSTLMASLAISAGTDIFLAATRYFYLRELKQGYMGVPAMVDAVVIFTINDGLLTCSIGIASMICFTLMRHNFVWVGIYFTLSKFYSNSIMATLNLRNWYRHRNRPYLGPQVDHTARTRPRVGETSKSGRSSATGDHEFLDLDEVQSVEVYVDQRVEYTVRAIELEGGHDRGRGKVRAGWPRSSRS